MVIVYDLDDTLYDEVDFVRSGFREIASYLGDNRYFFFMDEFFKEHGSGRVFNRLIENFSLKVSLERLIEIYRFHKPLISLDEETKELLGFSKEYKTALISDGNYIMQKNKFNTLKLKSYIDFPIFTDFFHTSKPDEKPYKMVMEKFPDESYVYIADNPKKDFIAPKKLGWKSIRYKNQLGIYKNEKNNADFEVRDKLEIKDILKELS